MSNKVVLCSASSYTQKFFINPDFTDLPKEILQNIKEICIILSAKTRGIFTVGFYEDGGVFLETQGDENEHYDELGAKLEIKRLQAEEKELIKSLQLWYVVFKTKDGTIVKEGI
jgi:hypothetical protein